MVIFFTNCLTNLNIHSYSFLICGKHVCRWQSHRSDLTYTHKKSVINVNYSKREQCKLVNWGCERALSSAAESRQYIIGKRLTLWLKQLYGPPSIQCAEVSIWTWRRQRSQLTTSILHFIHPPRTTAGSPHRLFCAALPKHRPAYFLMILSLFFYFFIHRNYSTSSHTF